ncbi:hypothetical protein ACOMHN_003101 [Nucella lapillus]
MKIKVMSPDPVNKRPPSSGRRQGRQHGITRQSRGDYCSLKGDKRVEWSRCKTVGVVIVVGRSDTSGRQCGHCVVRCVWLMVIVDIALHTSACLSGLVQRCPLPLSTCVILFRPT